MVASAAVRASQSGVMVIADAASAPVRASQAGLMVVANHPSEEVRASQAGLMVITNPEGVIHPLASSQLGLMVIARGQVGTPYVLAWTATLDGHEYYYLQLNDQTLVYDLLTERWYGWGSRDSRLWDAQIGIDWNANVSGLTFPLGGRETSSILVGDSRAGSLYFLDPERVEDDDYTGVEGVAFRRQIFGQIALQEYEFSAVPAVQLRGSIGKDTATDMTVTLFYSDDRGSSFVDCGALTLTSGVYDTRVEWRSLGSFRGQGRLFKIEDYGALTRIDGLDMPDG